MNTVNLAERKVTMQIHKLDKQLLTITLWIWELLELSGSFFDRLYWVGEKEYIIYIFFWIIADY